MIYEKRWQKKKKNWFDFPGDEMNNFVWVPILIMSHMSMLKILIWISQYILENFIDFLIYFGWHISMNHWLRKYLIFSLKDKNISILEQVKLVMQ